MATRLGYLVDCTAGTIPIVKGASTNTLESIANAAGFLYNNGAGAFSYDADVALRDVANTFNGGDQTIDGYDIIFHDEVTGTKFLTTGQPWRTFAQSVIADHTIRTSYNYDGTDRDNAAENAIMEGFESSFGGIMEWNLDLWPSAEASFTFRPWLYNYTWADGTSIFAAKGRLDIYQQKDDATPGLRVIPLADAQAANSVEFTNLALSPLVYFSPAGGLIVKPNANTIIPLQVIGAVGQTADLQRWLNSGLAIMASIDDDGSFTTASKLTTGGVAAINAAINTNVGLTIGGTVTSVDNAFGVYMGALTLTPADTFSAYSQYVGGGTIATGVANTIAGAYALYCESMAKGGTGTITNTFSIYAKKSTVGVGNFGAYIEGPSSIGILPDASYILKTDGYVLLNGLRIKGTDAANTIYQSNAATALAITTNGGNIIFGVGASTTHATVLTTGFTIGGGAAGVDYALTFDGETNNGVVTWMEDEDWFLFGDAVKTDNGRYRKVTTYTDTCNVLVTDEVIVFNKATAFTATMPTAVVGQDFYLKNIGAGNVTLAFPGVDTVDEVDSDLIVTQYDALHLICRAANAWVIA